PHSRRYRGAARIVRHWAEPDAETGRGRRRRPSRWTARRCHSAMAPPPTGPPEALAAVKRSHQCVNVARKIPPCHAQRAEGARAWLWGGSRREAPAWGGIPFGNSTTITYDADKLFVTEVED